MNASQTIAAEIASILAGNDIYDSNKVRWKFLLESYLGGDDYRRGNHLMKYQLETDAEYSARLRTTPLENHCASVISVYNSFLFRTPPQRTFGSIENMPELEDYLVDADFEGRSLDAFMKDVATWSGVFGHCWIMMAKPDVGAVTRADEQALGVRPYVNLLTPMVVTDWQWQRSASGRYELSYFKYLEDVNGDVRTVKEWTRETVRTTTVDLKRTIITADEIVENGLGVIPAVIAYNKHSTVRGLGIGDINDIADMQKFIYNSTSEVDQSIRLDSHPSLVKTPDTTAGIGAGSLIHMPEGLDPGLKPYLLEFNGASVDSIYRSIQHCIESIDKMANIGAVRATESRTMSGIAMETEFQLLNAKLSEKADSIELAEEQMWKLWCRYMGMTWDGTVDYPGSFNIRDTASEITQLKVAKDTATDARVLKEIDRQILQWMEVEDVEAVLAEPEGRTYENGEPIDARLPEAYRNATGESQQCENCAFYNTTTFACSAFGGAPVRPMWVCARWEDNQGE